MSTTTEKAVALRYGQDWDAARGLSYVMEYELDSLNRGALIQWLSQYPGEAEVLFRGTEPGDLNPLGVFLRISIKCIWSILSVFSQS